MRIFISHSSKDKRSYCDEVVKRLSEQIGTNSIVYDTLTFEAGEKTLDEINRTLAITDLYVILLSTNAVNSDWVKYELNQAHRKLEEKVLDRIYPIIIDPNLRYSDSRIPDWLKTYNLKYIARPAKAAKLIIERAKSYRKALRYTDSIFVGRNNLINDFEIRIDDFNKPVLNTFIVSGIPNIGRKSLAKYCIIKGSIVPQYYDFPQISLNYQESIEDFIIKINDLGFTSNDALVDIYNKSIEEKIAFAIRLTKEIVSYKEIILIKDDGCIVDYRGNIANWFKSIYSSPDLNEQIVFVIITKYKMNFESIRSAQSAFFLNVPELSRIERKGLLRRLAESNSLDLKRDDLERISGYLTGYPAQVYYAIDIIKNNGLAYLLRNLKLLEDYNEQEVSSLLSKYNDNTGAYNILALISEYDAISVNMLYEILNETPELIEVYESLFQECFFELEGVNGEYVRLNEVIQNYIARSGFKVLSVHRKKFMELFSKMFSDDFSSWYGVNDYLIGMRELVKEGKTVDPKYMIPSVYLKSMSDLYENMKYDDVVLLATRALQNIDNTDGKIIYEIRYLYCSALAKLKKTEFLSEIQKLDYNDKTFLKAFYYRQIGKNDRALECLNQLLSNLPEMSKAKREKVLVLKNLQQYDAAMDLAKENFYLYSDNPYHIQAYFECLINTYSNKPEDELLGNLLEKMSRIPSEKAKSMYGRCRALYYAYVDRNYLAAIEVIDQTIQDFPKDRKYAYTVEFDIALLFRDFEKMNEIITLLTKEGSNSNAVVICKSKMMAASGDVDGAISSFKKNISFFTSESIESFCDVLRTYR